MPASLFYFVDEGLGLCQGLLPFCAQKIDSRLGGPHIEGRRQVFEGSLRLSTGMARYRPIDISRRHRFPSPERPLECKDVLNGSS